MPCPHIVIRDVRRASPERHSKLHTEHSRATLHDKLIRNEKGDKKSKMENIQISWCVTIIIFMNYVMSHFHILSLQWMGWRTDMWKGAKGRRRCCGCASAMTENNFNFSKICIITISIFLFMFIVRRWFSFWTRESNSMSNKFIIYLLLRVGRSTESNLTPLAHRHRRHYYFACDK